MRDQLATQMSNMSLLKISEVSMKRIIYPGTFDPITNGHIDIIERTKKLCDELIIAVMVNPAKTTTFSEEERIEMIEKSIEHLKNVKVVARSGLTVKLAEEMNARALVRGIRAVMDYEFELRTATANIMLNPEIETIFLISKPEYSFISSSAVKEIAVNHGDVSNIVPEFVSQKLLERYEQ